MKKVLSNVQANKLIKLIQNDQVGRAGKMTAIANTSLGNMTLQKAQEILGASEKLVGEGLNNRITREAAVKAKMSLDAQGISEDASNYAQMFQNEMNGHSIDISLRVATE